MEQIKTDKTGANWRDPYDRGEELTDAQRCRSEQDNNDPRRIYWCGRCGHACGSYQCHYWAWCRKDNTRKDFHVCCPGSCSLDGDPEPNPVQPCHPAPDAREEWVKAQVAERDNIAVWRDMVDESEALRKKQRNA